MAKYYTTTAAHVYPLYPCPGESNAIYFKSGYYECALAALLASWRAAFNSPAAWFGVMQARQREDH